MYAVSLSLTRLLEIGVFLFDEAEELDSFYINCIVKFKKNWRFYRCLILRKVMI